MHRQKLLVLAVRLANSGVHFWVITDEKFDSPSGCTNTMLHCDANAVTAVAMNPRQGPRLHVQSSLHMLTTEAALCKLT